MSGPESQSGFAPIVLAGRAADSARPNMPAMTVVAAFPTFLRAHLSVCRLLDHAKELGILKEVSDEGDFFEKRDIPALVSTVGDWNAFIAAGVGAY